MKLTRKVFAATMIVALLVMLIPQVGLAHAPTNCPEGYAPLVKFDWTSSGYVPNVQNSGVTLTGTTFYGDWTSTVPIFYITFKDGAINNGTYTLNARHFLGTAGANSGSFNLGPANSNYLPIDGLDVVLPSAASPANEGGRDYNGHALQFLPTTPEPPVTEWPNDKDISHIEFCRPGTAVTLDTFSASASSGQVKLVWKTASETNNAGFNLYRATSLDGGQLVQVNSKLISASMEATDGASYSFVDKSGAGTFYYWLEDVDFSGQTVRHGPVKVSVKPLLRRPVYRPLGPAY